MTWPLAIVAGVVLAVAAVSRRLTGTAVTPAMVVVAAGLLLGPLAIDEIRIEPASATVRTLAEATLAVVLFSDASSIRFRALRREYGLPVRLLGLGLPGTIALGAVAAAALFPGLSAAEALILAIVLAPTDAALGQAVVTEPRLPSRIRQGLNVESGLNDGICVPLLLIALAAAGAAGGGHHSAAHVVVEEIGWGIVGGVAGGLAASLGAYLGARRDLATPSWRRVVPVAGAALAYWVAAGLGGSGFIAAYVAGGVFGGTAHEESERSESLAEDLGQVLGAVTLLVFGAVLLGPALKSLDWRTAAYAALSLTVVRMGPVALAMLGSGARPPTLGFVGWFGPRGLASIVFAVVVIQEADLPGASTILTAAYVTVGASVFAHGVSAAPLAERYARWCESHPPRRRRGTEGVPAPEPRPSPGGP